MCLKCKDLQIDESIHCQIELDRILTLLKSKPIFSNITITCLFTNKTIFNIEDLDESQQFGVINLKVNCIHCDEEYRLFADTAPYCIGFFNPLYASDSQGSSQKVL